MPPNVNDGPALDPEAVAQTHKATTTSQKAETKSDNYSLKLSIWAMNSLAHTLIGVTVAVCLWYALQNITSRPLSQTQQHIVLCVVGYQLLMAEAILVFTSGNGWSTPMKIKHKKLLHWVIQIIGSALALAGNIIGIMMKWPNNFNTNHGILALVAMVCTVISLINGLTSLYAYELRSYISPNLGKLSHIFFGAATIIFSTVSLCYGFDKNGFRNWASPQFAYVLMAFAAFYTIAVIINPILSMRSRIKRS